MRSGVVIRTPWTAATVPRMPTAAPRDPFSIELTLSLWVARRRCARAATALRARRARSAHDAASPALELKQLDDVPVRISHHRVAKTRRVRRFLHDGHRRI